MRKTIVVLSSLLVAVIIFISCNKKTDVSVVVTPTFDAVRAAFGSNIDPAALANYANQTKPAYLNPAKDNTGGNVIVNTKATLGRVLFYDKNLSIDNSVSCGSCHKQEFAFGDTAIQSRGVATGLTGRHSMRLINTRFAVENKFFWNERAATLELQTTQPIQDHAEMGFSGVSGRPNFAAMITKLQGIAYYKELFQFVYNDQNITEARMQECMAQFIRSIQSFDAKYDVGRAQVPNDNAPFPNFTAGENAGKNLFLTPPTFDATGNRTGGGLGCNGCHNAPEFDIDPQSRNNGIIGTIGSNVLDLLNTRAPSLRDVMNANGNPNSPMMHTGVFTTMQQVLGHYGNINVAPGNNNLDGRLRPGGNPQKLNLTAQEVINVVAFIKTLTGTNVYTDAKWKNPFL
jgi:cytochrome c peroxidase